MSNVCSLSSLQVGLHPRTSADHSLSWHVFSNLHLYHTDFCDLDYDPFLFMQDNKMEYGFTCVDGGIICLSNMCAYTEFALQNLNLRIHRNHPYALGYS